MPIMLCQEILVLRRRQSNWKFFNSTDEGMVAFVKTLAVLCER